ncbi:MAG: helix-turn-helix transcriptional regulator [Rhodoglobus sp.]|nr:helix-turn-helix transcriptional regulator [Rhodoglobus sp.]
MRRKAGSLISIEAEILEAALRLRRSGEDRFHGFLIAKQLEHGAAAGTLTAHGTLYKALGRLETAGLLESNWEDPEIAAAAGRPRRRLYEITGSAERALAVHRAQTASSSVGQLGLDLA